MPHGMQSTSWLGGESAKRIEPADVAMSCAVEFIPALAHFLPRPVHRIRRWAHAWFRLKVPAQPFTSIRLNMHKSRSITLDHGAGGSAMRKLIEDCFVSRFKGLELQKLNDAAKLNVTGAEIAVSTDSYVVQPLVFPGGDVGKLAVCGTVNDLLVMGALPRWMSIAMIIEEGLPLETLEALCDSIAQTAFDAGVEIVTGDTKVVPHGQCDELFINTTGIGTVPLGSGLSRQPIAAGDAVIVSGTLGDHAAAILAARGGFSFAHSVQSDCAALVNMVSSVLHSHDGVKWMRDATRGGVAAVLEELALSNCCAVTISEDAVPIEPETRALCELLGFDPLHLANEGKIVMIVDRKQAEQIVQTLRATHDGRNAAQVGEISSTDSAVLLLETSAGGTRRLHRPTGELLPRIC